MNEIKLYACLDWHDDWSHTHLGFVFQNVNPTQWQEEMHFALLRCLFRGVFICSLGDESYFCYCSSKANAYSQQVFRRIPASLSTISQNCRAHNTQCQSLWLPCWKRCMNIDTGIVCLRVCFQSEEEKLLTFRASAASSRISSPSGRTTSTRPRN